MSYPTLRPEYWEEQRQQQRAQEARIGRTGGGASVQYCTAARGRWWGLMFFALWLTYALRTLDLDGEWLMGLLIVGTPAAVLLVGWVLKLWCKCCAAAPRARARSLSAAVQCGRTAGPSRPHC